MNDSILYNLLKRTRDDTVDVNDTNDNYNYDQEGDTAKIQCENELYPLLLENEF